MQQDPNIFINSNIGALNDFDAWLASLSDEELDDFANRMAISGQ